MAREIEAADDEPAIGAGSRRLRGEELSLLKGHLFGQTTTTTMLGEERVSLWTASLEASFRDDMYASGHRWRVLLLTGMQPVFVGLAAVDPCLTMEVVITSVLMLLLLANELRLHQLRDTRRKRRLSELMIALVFPMWGVASIGAALWVVDESSPTWDGSECTLERLSLETVANWNTVAAPSCLFIPLTVTSMTVSSWVYGCVCAGGLLPALVAYLIVGLSLPSETATGTPLSRDGTLILGVVSIVGCWVAGTFIGCSCVGLQRSAAIHSAERRIEQMKAMAEKATKETEEGQDKQQGSTQDTQQGEQQGKQQGKQQKLRSSFS